MVDIRDLTNIIIKGIYNHLGKILVPINDLQPKEPYPYLTYNFTSIYIPFEGQGNYTHKLITSLDDRFEHDIEETIELQPTATLSINGYSEDVNEAYEAAKEIMNWFKHRGYQYLADNDIVVVDVTTVMNRTIHIVDHYEFRFGFDVIIRFSDVIDRRVETIEEYSIKEVKK